MFPKVVCKLIALLWIIVALLCVVLQREYLGAITAVLIAMFFQKETENETD